MCCFFLYLFSLVSFKKLHNFLVNPFLRSKSLNFDLSFSVRYNKSNFVKPLNVEQLMIFSNKFDYADISNIQNKKNKR